MTETVNQLDANTNTWRDLLGTVNEIADIISTKVVSTGGAANGNVQVDGFIRGTELYDNLQRVVTHARIVNVGTGLTGGGNLSNNITISLSSNTQALLAKANSALQTSDFTGKIGLLDKLDVSKIDTVSGTANSSNVLYGDGAWRPISGTMMAKSVYDPTNINASPFERANHSGTQAISTIVDLQTTLDSKFNAAGGTISGKVNLTANTANNAALNIAVGSTPANTVSGDVYFTNTDIIVRLGANTNAVWHSNNLTKPSQAEAQAGTANTARAWSAERDFQAFMAFMTAQQATLKWMSRGIGEYYAVNDAMTGADVPPTNDSRFRYIKLTAGQGGSGQYNEGVLISESISGSAPLVVATGTINLVGSPLNGLTVNLINTEGRFLRASTSAGTVQDDAMQNITGTLTNALFNNTAQTNGALSFGSSADANLTAGGSQRRQGQLSIDASAVARTDTENRPKNIGVTYYMRIM